MVQPGKIVEMIPIKHTAQESGGNNQNNEN